MTSADHHDETSTPEERAEDVRLVELLHARAEHLAQPLAREELESDSLEVLMLNIVEDRFAIETRFVKEVLRDADLTPVPGNAAPLSGVINLRGEILAVMSLGGVLPLEQMEDADSLGDWIIVVGIDQARFGIPVTEATEVAALSLDEILDPAPGTPLALSNLVRGVTKDARVILDGDAMLNEDRFVIDDQE